MFSLCDPGGICHAEHDPALQDGEKETVVKQEIQETEQKVETKTALEGVNDDIWRSILAQVRPINASIEALLRAAKPIAYDGVTLTLGVYYKFHKERLEDSTHRRVLEDVIAEILNGPTRIVCVLTEPPVKVVVDEAEAKPVLTESKDRDIIKVAEEIFGN